MNGNILTLQSVCTNDGAALKANQFVLYFYFRPSRITADAGDEVEAAEDELLLGDLARPLCILHGHHQNGRLRSVQEKLVVIFVDFGI